MRSRLPLLALALWAAGCGAHVTEPRSADPAAGGPVRSFRFPALGGSELSSATTRGRATVLLVVTTYDLASQVAVRELSSLARAHRPRISAGVVVLEPPANAPLVEAFQASLAPPFPVAQVDPRAFGAGGPFGRVDIVPTWVLLDAAGVERWRAEGIQSTRNIESQLASAESAGAAAGVSRPTAAGPVGTDAVR